MSRSYKKSPYWTYNNVSRFQKRIANRKVRKYLKNMNNYIHHKNYKKIYDSWNICDACCRLTKQDAIQAYEEDLKAYYNKVYKGNKVKVLEKPVLKDYLKWWRKDFHTK